MQRTVTKVTKAVFPIAGLGTRFLPATKAIPKEVITLVDRPLIQYAIDEAAAAGIKEFIFVTSKGKSALEDYFDCNAELESALRAQGKDDLLQIVQDTNIESGAIAYVRQQRPLGLGHAVWCARNLVANEPFVVILPDDVIAAPKPCLQQMLEAHAELGGDGNMVAVMDVPRQDTPKYGILDVDAGDVNAVCPRVRGLVEKPSVTAAPSTLAIVGRYILTPNVLRNLTHQKEGAANEIQLTDAIAAEIERSGVHGYRFSGLRYDCGTKAGLLKAAVGFALEREDLGAEISDFLRNLTIPNRSAP